MRVRVRGDGVRDFEDVVRAVEEVEEVAVAVAEGGVEVRERLPLAAEAPRRRAQHRRQLVRRGEVPV